MAGAHPYTVLHVMWLSIYMSCQQVGKYVKVIEQVALDAIFCGLLLKLSFIFFEFQIARKKLHMQGAQITYHYSVLGCVVMIGNL